MADLDLLDARGRVLPTGKGGMEALLDNEFDPWFVRVRRNRINSIFVPYKDSSLALPEEASGLFSRPKYESKSATKRAHYHSRAGLVEFFADAALTAQLFPTLRISPANLTEMEFRTVLADLRRLAYEVGLTVEAWDTEAPSVKTDGDGPQADRFERIVAGAEAAIELLASLVEQLPIIRQRPAQELTRALRRVPEEIAYRRGGAQYAARQPERPGVLMPVTVATGETTEARFVHEVVRRVLRDADLLAGLLSTRVSEIDAGAAEKRLAFERFGRQSTGAPSSGTVGVSRDQCLQAIVELQQLSDTVRRAWPAPEMPVGRWDGQVSNRMELSSEYGPLLTRWRVYGRRAPITTSTSLLVDRLAEQTILRTPFLFERWVTVRIYAGLVERGFHPPEGEPSLLQELRVVGGDVRIGSSGGSLHLIRGHPRGPIALRLDFDVTLQDVEPVGKRPDLLLRVSHAGRNQYWVFDAKYKDYNKPVPGGATGREMERRYGTHHNSDRLGVAEHKYREPMGAQIGGILHSDSRAQFIDWDQLPSEGSPLPHGAISIPLRPNSSGEEHLTKLFRLLFGFKLGLADTCWRCGVAAREIYYGQGVGTGYSCPSCQAFWIDTWCKSCHCPLHKYGPGSFHMYETDAPFNVHCPECGDHFRDGTTRNP